jgi:hypothetical protein
LIEKLFLKLNQRLALIKHAPSAIYFVVNFQWVVAFALANGLKPVTISLTQGSFHAMKHPPTGSAVSRKVYQPTNVP